MKIEDAIKRYESWAEDDRIDILIRKEHRQMADWLKELKADRPQGEWIFDDPLRADFECSECLERSDICTPFCPNCGARMKGADDD